MQAATGLALGGEERLRSTLTAVRDTADASLTAVRQLVSVLRSDTGEITPLADLRTIPVLIETTRGSGTRINAMLPRPGVLERCNEGWSAIQRLTLVRLVGEERFGQIFITDTNRQYLDSILESIRKEYAMFHVDVGMVTAMEDGR